VIKFNQPRYILPLIVLPFVYVFFYLIGEDTFGQKQENKLLEETSAINTNIPDPFLNKSDMSDKFDAYRKAHKNKRNFSAMQEIDVRREVSVQEASIAELSLADSIAIGERIALSPEPPQVPTQISAGTSTGIDPGNTKILEHKTSINISSAKPKNDPEETEYEKQMKLFKAQMNYVDSLFADTAEKNERGEGEESVNGNGVKGKSGDEEQWESRDSESPTVNFVRKRKGNISKHFNTLKREQNELFIRAIIDEELTMVKDSRVRIRLLEEVYIGDVLIKKNQYLYGLVSAFKPQRIDIQIHSVLAQGSIYEIALEVYDTDGMRGLYVPKSGFRELSKDLGGNVVSSQNFNINQSPGNGMELLYGMANDAVQSTSRAASKAIKKNKATLKYGTIVHLVNTQKQ
jgi:hypothetical protein